MFIFNFALFNTLYLLVFLLKRTKVRSFLIFLGGHIYFFIFLLIGYNNLKKLRSFFVL